MKYMMIVNQFILLVMIGLKKLKILYIIFIMYIIYLIRIFNIYPSIKVGLYKRIRDSLLNSNENFYIKKKIFK